jgi:hypothetical protein
VGNLVADARNRHARLMTGVLPVAIFAAASLG